MWYQSQLNYWERTILRHTFIHENLRQLMQTFRYDAHPMGILIRSLSSLSFSYYSLHNCISNTDLNFQFSSGNGNVLSWSESCIICTDLSSSSSSLFFLFRVLIVMNELQGSDIYQDQKLRNKQIFRILGKLPTIAACAYRHRIGRYEDYLIFEFDSLL